MLTVTFPFKRRMGYYIIQVYIPCVFLVMLSWIVFWMRPDDSASRLTVGITTILTIVFLLGYTNGMLPKVIICFLWTVTFWRSPTFTWYVDRERAKCCREKKSHAGLTVTLLL